MEVKSQVTGITVTDRQTQSNVVLEVVGSKNLPVVIEPVVLQAVKGQRVMDIIQISDADRVNAIATADKFDFKDTNAVLTFAAAPQQAYLEKLKELLGGAKVKELGSAGDIILQLERGIDMIDLKKMKKEIMTRPGFFTKLFNRLFSSIKAYMAKHQELLIMVDNIETDTKELMEKLMLDIARLDQMHEEIKRNFYVLGVYIYAGEVAMERGYKEFEEMRQAVIVSGDPVKITEVNDFREQLTAMDVRLLRLKTAYVSAPKDVQQVRVIQQSSRIEVQNLMETVLFDLPQLVKTINNLLALFNMKGAEENRERRQQLREQLQQVEGDLIDETALRAREGCRYGEKEVLMLEQSVNKLMETCKKIKGIDLEDEQGRKASETLLIQVMENFKSGMQEINAPAPIR